MEQEVVVGHTVMGSTHIVEYPTRVSELEHGVQFSLYDCASVGLQEMVVCEPGYMVDVIIVVVSVFC